MAHSFEKTFESEFAPLHRYLRRRVGESTADELAAQTFATAYASWDRLDPTRPVGLAIVGYPAAGCQRAYNRLQVIGVNEYFGW